MNVLFTFFLRYLLAPLLVVVFVFILKNISKGRAVLSMKKLIIFVLVTSIILALPSILGLLKYEFVWGGLILTIIFYLLMGVLFNWFSKSNAFKAIGFEGNKWYAILALFIAMILGAWIYYLVFGWLSKLSYSAWAMFNVLWFLTPPFYLFSKKVFLEMPSPFYNSWTVAKDDSDDEYWDNVDVFRLMQVNVKIKRSLKSNQYSSFLVKLPKDVPLGLWFNRFIGDQNIRFPNDVIELESEKGQFGWIFYTNKWLPIPLFTRMLDFESDVVKNKIKNKSTIYVRRVFKDAEKEKSEEKTKKDS